MLALLLLGIDNIAAQLEEPLTRLPLVIYAASLSSDVRHVWRVAGDAAACAAGAAPAVARVEGEGEEGGGKGVV